MKKIILMSAIALVMSGCGGGMFSADTVCDCTTDSKGNEKCYCRDVTIDEVVIAYDSPDALISVNDNTVLVEYLSDDTAIFIIIEED